MLKLKLRRSVTGLWLVRTVPVVVHADRIEINSTREFRLLPFPTTRKAA
jgi:hypothetical protein